MGQGAWGERASSPDFRSLERWVSAPGTDEESHKRWGLREGASWLRAEDRHSREKIQAENPVEAATVPGHCCRQGDTQTGRGALVEPRVQRRVT